MSVGLAATLQGCKQQAPEEADLEVLYTKLEELCSFLLWNPLGRRASGAFSVGWDSLAGVEAIVPREIHMKSPQNLMLHCVLV